MARAEPLNQRNWLSGSFHAAIFIGYAGNDNVAVYFYAIFFSGYAGNASMTFYFYARFCSAYTSNDNMTLVVLIFLLRNLAGYDLVEK